MNSSSCLLMLSISARLHTTFEYIFVNGVMQFSIVRNPYSYFETKNPKRLSKITNKLKGILCFTERKIFQKNVKNGGM